MDKIRPVGHTWEVVSDGNLLDPRSPKHKTTYQIGNHVSLGLVNDVEVFRETVLRIKYEKVTGECPTQAADTSAQ